jgi:5S rRNA maturation endonuclease (ribonuclease M5)
MKKDKKTKLYDLNDARPQGHYASGQLTSEDYIRRLKDDMNAQAFGVLSYLFPNGKREGSEFVVGGLHGKPGRSLKISMAEGKIGVGEDFATGEKFGDLIDVWQKQRNMDFRDTCEEVERFLGRPFKEKPVVSTQQKNNSRSLPPPAAQYQYTDEKGIVLGVVYRYEFPDGTKEFRPWDAKAGKNRMPIPRPLYNLVAVSGSENVVLVEGEKCVDALQARGIVATTAMGGSKAPLEKTDWSPLLDKSIIVWSDNDAPGVMYGSKVGAYLREIGVENVQVIKIPSGKPEGWDAADAVTEGIELEILSQTEPAQLPKGELSFRIQDWQANIYQGKAPEQEFLVEGTFPLSTSIILAGMGDSGKGMVTLDLAVKVATGSNNRIEEALGGTVLSNGNAVIFTAEDDKDEIHRRLEKIDKKNRRKNSKHGLFIIPLPNAGGPFAIVQDSRDGPAATPEWHAIRKQLNSIHNVKLVVFDPLASFVHADINADPAAGAFATGMLASLATELNATVIVCHHMAKGSARDGIKTPEQARHAIRGTTAIVDGMRGAFAFWQLDETDGRKICKKLKMNYERNVAYAGAVVKSNGPADRGVRIFIRNKETGLLEYRNRDLLEITTPTAMLLEKMTHTIAARAVEGYPYTSTGMNGVWELRHTFTTEFHTLPKNSVRDLLQQLLNDGKVRKCVSKGSQSAKWLDIPGGPFDRGDGQHMHGSASDRDRYS